MKQSETKDAVGMVVLMLLLLVYSSWLHFKEKMKGR